MSSTPLLSTYRQGENRITSSTPVVLERVGLSLTEEILPPEPQVRPPRTRSPSPNQSATGTD